MPTNVPIFSGTATGIPFKIRHLSWRTLCTAHGVFRLDQEIGEDRIRFSIAGRVSAESAELLERCCQQALKDGKAVDLVLDKVTMIDEAGHALLHKLASKGVCLSANGLYNSFVVASIRERIGSNKR